MATYIFYLCYNFVEILKSETILPLYYETETK